MEMAYVEMNIMLKQREEAGLEITGVEGVDWARRDRVEEEVLMDPVQVSGGVPPLTCPNYHLAGFIILIYTPSGNGSVPRFLSLFSVLYL